MRFKENLFVIRPIIFSFSDCVHRETWSQLPYPNSSVFKFKLDQKYFPDQAVVFNTSFQQLIVKKRKRMLAKA